MRDCSRTCASCLLTHNREYWNAVSSVPNNFYQFGLWTLIIYKFLKLITSQPRPHGHMSLVKKTFSSRETYGRGDEVDNLC